MMAIVGGLVGGLNDGHCGWVGGGLNDGHCGWVGGGGGSE